MSPEIPVPDGSAIITPNMQYAELQALRQSVDKLAATVDPAFADLRKDVHELDQKHREDYAALTATAAAHQVQIDANTQWRNRLIGGFIVLTLLIGWGALNLAPLVGK